MDNVRVIIKKSGGIKMKKGFVILFLAAIIALGNSSRVLAADEGKQKILTAEDVKDEKNIESLSIKKVKDFEYTVDTYAKEVTITQYIGNSKKVIIPSSIEGAQVTTIGENAFYNCRNLTSVTIPDSVTNIDWYAFYNCRNLTSVTIPDSVTNIGLYAFYNCSSLTSINIPAKVTSISSGAFKNCSNLTSIKIPDRVTKIREGAFSGCSRLASINVPNGVTSIDMAVFENCTSLKGIKLPEGMKNIAENAFSGCSSLKSIKIPDGVRDIGWGAFYDCGGLTSLNIPDSVTGIGDNAFAECSKLASINISKGLRTIGWGLFNNCSSLKSIKIPSNITEIKDFAFNGCTSLASVTISDSVTSIGAWSFNQCSELKSIKLPKGITEIEEGTFYSCSSLNSVIVPGSVTNIAQNAFSMCGKLKKMVMQGNAPKTDSSTLYGCNPVMFIYIPKGAAGYNKLPWKEYRVTYGDGVDHKITYDANGGKNAPSPQKKTCSVEANLSKTKPTRTGYTFQGWGTSKTATKSTYKPGASYKTDKDLTLYAVWKANSYKVAFNKNRGSGSMSTVSRTYNKVSVLPSNTFKRPGYKFNVWNTKADGTGTKYADKASVKNLTSVSGRTVTLYAQWVKGQKVAYNANGGKSSAASKTVYKGYSYGTLTTPARKGYTFAGWYTAKSGGSKVTSSTKVTKSSSHTLYAHWTKNKYTVKYVLNGGKNNSKNPSSYDITSADITLKNPSRTGYTFAGWYTNSSYKTKAARITKGSTGNKVFYAKWTANTYTIRYHKNGGTSGSMADTKSCKYGTSYTLRGNAFKRTGYKFAGWATSASGGVVYQDKAGVRNLTSTNKAVKILYAKWTPVTYTINYDLNGGKNGGNPSTYKVSTSTITLKNPTKTGYTFKGWYADSGYKKKVTQIPKGSTGTKKLYAKWKANIYQVIFDGNGATAGSIEPMSCEYGKAYTLPENSYERYGWAFTGWNTKVDGSGIEYESTASVKNMTSKAGQTMNLYAQWEAIPTAINLPESEKTLCVGETYQLRPLVESKEPVEAEFIYSSENEEIAEVDQTGLLTAVSPGDVTIYCEVTGEPALSASITIHVITLEILPKSISITEAETLEIGEEIQLTCTVLPEDASDKSVTWHSSDENIVTVDEEGRIHGIDSGMATVTATVGDNIQANCVVKVESVSLEMVRKIGNQYQTVNVGDTEVIPVNTAECDLYMQVKMSGEVIRNFTLGIYVAVEDSEESAYTEIGWNETYEKQGEYWYYPIESAFVGQTGNVSVYCEWFLGNEQEMRSQSVGKGSYNYLNLVKEE